MVTVIVIVLVFVLVSRNRVGRRRPPLHNCHVQQIPRQRSSSSPNKSFIVTVSMICGIGMDLPPTLNGDRHSWITSTMFSIICGTRKTTSRQNLSCPSQLSLRSSRSFHHDQLIVLITVAITKNLLCSSRLSLCLRSCSSHRHRLPFPPPLTPPRSTIPWFSSGRRNAPVGLSAR